MKELVDELDADFFVCGPTPFMDVVEGSLFECRRRSPPDPDRAVHPGRGREVLDAGPCRITIELDGRTAVADHHPARRSSRRPGRAGLSPPFVRASRAAAPRAWPCSLEGSVQMHVNNAPTDDEVAEGWILTCQSVPTSPTSPTCATKETDGRCTSGAHLELLLAATRWA